MDRISVSPGVRLLGVTGAPGAGKSTFAGALAAAHGGVVVPMDGFHLADVELVRRGLRDRKGAPETFDAEGYAALLARVAARDGLVMAPAFERGLEQPVAASIPVPPEAELVVTEGNYLLLDEPRWVAVREGLDEVWHVRVDEDAAPRATRRPARRVRQVARRGAGLGRPGRPAQRRPRRGGRVASRPDPRPHRLGAVTGSGSRSLVHSATPPPSYSVTVRSPSAAMATWPKNWLPSRGD